MRGGNPQRWISAHPRPIASDSIRITVSTHRNPLSRRYRKKSHKRGRMCQGGHQPCLYCHPHGYIRMVQHLIEVCLILRMGMDDCVEALAQHAGIEPLVTLTVWRELMKENREFFQAYSPATSQNSPTNKPLHGSFGIRTRR